MDVFKGLGFFAQNNLRIFKGLGFFCPKKIKDFEGIEIFLPKKKSRILKGLRIF